MIYKTRLNKTTKTMVNIHICLNLFLKNRELVPESNDPNLKVAKIGLKQWRTVVYEE